MATEQKKNKYWNMKILNESAAEITLYGSITGEGWFSESSSKAFQSELKSLGDVNSIDLYINSPVRMSSRTGYSFYAPAT